MMKLALRGQTAYLGLVQGALGYEWLKAGIEKATSAGYVPGMGATVTAFAGKNNPNQWFASFLTGTVLPHATGFAYLVMYGELLAGAGLLLGAIFMVLRTQRRLDLIARAGSAAAAVGALLLSLSFWQAAGWMSASTDGINVVMAMVEAVLFAAAVAALLGAREPRATAERSAIGKAQLTHVSAHR